MKLFLIDLEDWFIVYISNVDGGAISFNYFFRLRNDVLCYFQTLSLILVKAAISFVEFLKWAVDRLIFISTWVSLAD
jgi:hypothetical protein